ncbi:MAG: ABC transporter permease, partial [Planctomycetes bacterium]|nr:ABC transporter permease [Planctomycetota bacterium]
MIGPVGWAQRWFEDSCRGAGYSIELLLRSAAQLPRAPRKWREIVAQTFQATFGSMPVVFLTALFAGMILALQTGIELARFGQQDLIGAAVSVTLAREMAPFMTGLIVAANVGSAMAAELGTMAVSEEVEALEV